MDVDDGIELQHRSKPAEASIRGCDGISEDDGPSPDANAGNSKAPSRQLDVRIDESISENARLTP